MKPIIVLFCLLTFSVQAKDYGNIIVTDIVSIYDADTFRINIKDYPSIIGEGVSIRVNGVDAPEIRGKCESEKIAAQNAREFTVHAIQSAKIVELRNIERGKYFRILADVYVGDVSLATELIHAGHARAYDGGKRNGWCKEK